MRLREDPGGAGFFETRQLLGLTSVEPVPVPSAERFGKSC